MDAYRDATATCPRCGVGLEHRDDAAACRECGGMWIPEARLDEMLRAMHYEASSPEFTPRPGAAKLACPACRAQMVAVALQGVEIDRCAQGHGVWFDSRELEAAVHAAAAFGAGVVLDGVPQVRIGLGRELLGMLGELLNWRRRRQKRRDSE